MKFSVVKNRPSPQTQVDIFDWSYRLPLQDVNSGSWDGFRHKPSWIDRCELFFGEIKELRSLEIGPNEGEITYQLFNHGVRDLTSIEARPINFLKCLVVKNLFRMDSVRLMCGDALLHLEESIYDMCYCAGVFYHAKDPLVFAQSLTKGCKRMVICTHYYSSTCRVYDKNNVLEQRANQVNWNMDNDSTEIFNVDGKNFRKIRHYYQEGVSHEQLGHGGIENYAYMMPLVDIVAMFEVLGWKIVGVDDNPNASRGSFACIYAENKSI